MNQVPSDEEVGRQILGIFLRHKVCAGGTIGRNNFVEVDFSASHADPCSVSG